MRLLATLFRSRERTEGVIAALRLQEHRALIVSHGDQDHPHMHLLINRVHPETGLVWNRWHSRCPLSQTPEPPERSSKGARVDEVIAHLKTYERLAELSRALARGATLWRRKRSRRLRSQTHPSGRVEGRWSPALA